MDHAFGAVEPHHLVVLVADDPPVVLAVAAFCRGDECGRRAPASLELASPNYREYQEQYYCQAQLPGHNEPCYSCLNSCACLCGRGEATPRAT